MHIGLKSLYDQSFLMQDMSRRMCALRCACDAYATHTRARVWVVWPTITLGYKSVSVHMRTSIDVELYKYRSCT